MSRPFRVGITGSYGGLNLGDEAILEAILEQLRTALPIEFTVFSRHPEDTLRRHRVDHAVPVRQLSRAEAMAEVRRLDLLIFGGGGILYDAEAQTYLREVQLAHQQDVPVMVYAVSAGPLSDRSVQALVRDNLDKAALLTVRERDAKHLLEEIGVHREIRVTADPALVLRTAVPPRDTLVREQLDGNRRLIGMSVREPGLAAPHLSQEDYHGLLANAADFMVERFDADIIFIPMERLRMDVQQSHAVISRMLRAPRATVLRGTYTSGELLSLMKRLSFAVGMRLHFLIFAALQLVPFVALPYASKVSGFIDELNLPMPPLKLVNAGRLIAHLDDAWDRQRSIRRQIELGLPALRERALLTSRLAIDLLKNHS